MQIPDLGITVLDRITDGIVVLDKAWCFTYVNKAATTMLNRQSPADLIGKNYWKEYPEATGTPFARAYRSALEEQQPIVIEGYYAPWDRWFENRIYPTPDGLTILISDVTPHKQADERTLRINRALRMVSTCNQAMIHTQDEQMLLSAVCRAIVNIGGYRLAWVGFAEQDDAKNVRVVAHYGFEQEYLESLQITWADVASGGGPTGTAIRTGKTTIARDIIHNPQFAPWREQALRRGYASSIALPLLAEGKAFGALNIYATKRDAFDNAEVQLLTELAGDLAYGIMSLHVRAEHARAQAQLAYQANLLANINDAVIASDIHFTITSWNRAAEEIYGWTAEKAIGQSIRELLSAEIVGGKPGDIRRALAETGQFRGEMIQYRKDGTPINIETNIITLTSADGSISGFVGVNRDITERKQAEDQLRTSEANLNRAQTVAHTGSWNLDAPQGTLVWSTETYRIFGIPPENPSNYEAFLARVHPDDRDTVDRSWQAALRGAPYGIEHRIIVDGQVKWVRERAEIETDSNGNLLRCIGTVQDITARKRAEAALEASEARYRDFYENVDDVIYQTDCNGIITDVSPSVEKHFGYRQEEIIGRSVKEFYVDRREYVALNVALERSGAVNDFEILLKHKEGRQIPTSVTSRIIFDAQDQPIAIEGVLRNITERKQAETALQESESSLQAILESTADGILAVSKDNKVLYSNERFVEMWRIPPEVLASKDDSFILQHILDQLVDPQCFLQKVSAVYQSNKESFDTLNFKDGRVFERYSRPMSLGSESLGRVWSFRDITARVRAEEEIKKRAERLALLNRIIAAAGTTLEPKAVLETICRELALAFDVPQTAATLLNETNTAFDVVAEYLAKGRPSAMGVALPIEDNPATQYVVEHKVPLAIADAQHDPRMGAVRDVMRQRGTVSLLILPLMVRDRVVGTLGLDAIEQREFTEEEIVLAASTASAAAQALENAHLFEAEHKARQISDTLSEIARELNAAPDLNTALDLVLSYMERVIAFDSGSVLLFENGKIHAVAVQGFAEPERVRNIRLNLDAALLNKEVIETKQPLIVNATSDDPRWVEAIKTSGLAHDLAKIHSWLGVPLLVRDRVIGMLTADKVEPHFYGPEDAELALAFAAHAAIAIENARLYDEIRRHAAELEQKVEGRTAELTVANKKLKAVDRMKSEFVSNVSHELRTPLANIKIYLHLLERGKPEKHARYMETLRRETNLLQSLIEDLLHLSRLDLGKAKPVLTPVDVNQMAAQLVSDRATLFADRDLVLKVHIEPDLPLIQADEKMLIQVLTNLMTNAMNYTPRGGTVTVKTRYWVSGIEHSSNSPTTSSSSPTSDNQPPASGTWVGFSVTDTGRGIPLAEQERLFERFFRGDAARQAKAPGTGLGLAISQELVRAHGGRITVMSQVGKGSTFTVWLPAA